MTRIDHGQLCIAAAAQQGADPVADRPACDALSDGLDLAGDFKPQNVRRAGGRGVGAGALQQVRPVHTRRPHPDQHLTRPRDGIGPFGDLQGPGRSGTAFDFDHAHRTRLAFVRIRAFR